MIKYSRSQWPRGLRRGSTAVRFLLLGIRIPPAAWTFVCCDCRVLLRRGLCDELIIRPEESYRLWCVLECDLETWWMRTPWTTEWSGGAVECPTPIKMHFIEISQTLRDSQNCLHFNNARSSRCRVRVTKRMYSYIWFTFHNSQRKIQQDATMYENFIITYLLWNSTYFGRHTAHHQEPKTAMAASGFSYVEGCWTCSWWTFSGILLDFFLYEFYYDTRIHDTSSVFYFVFPNSCALLWLNIFF
jgi:hypothetical protein